MDIPIVIDDGNKVLKVTIEKKYDILEIKGKEAEKWVKHNRTMATILSLQGQNPFDYDSINWKVKNK